MKDLTKFIFLVFTLLLFSLSTSAANKNTYYDSFKKCFDSVKDFKRAEMLLVKDLEKKYSGMELKESQAVYNANYLEANLVRLVAPYLLPGTIAQTEKDCWIYLRDFELSVDSDIEKAKEAMSTWKSCLIHAYKKLPKEAAVITSCFEKIKK